MKKLLFLYLLFWSNAYQAQQKVPDYYSEDAPLSAFLQKTVQQLGLDQDFEVGEDGIEQISLAVIDLNSPIPKIGGVNMDNFIYPASVYKMYVAAEVLHQISIGRYNLSDVHIIKSPNVVDKSKELPNDPRALLKEGDTLTVNYLLDLMITRSDNSASNLLIDIAQRPNINKLMAHNQWQGSEVTRKFLKRSYEDPGYEKVPGTMTNALHAADFMYKVETNQLVNPWVSMQMKALLGRQLDHGKLAKGFPSNVMYYNKTGWWSYWTNDVGIVDDGEHKYIIACFLPLEEQKALPLLAQLAQKVHSYMLQRSSMAAH